MIQEFAAVAGIEFPAPGERAGGQQARVRVATSVRGVDRARPFRQVIVRCVVMDCLVGG